MVRINVSKEPDVNQNHFSVSDRNRCMSGMLNRHKVMIKKLTPEQDGAIIILLSRLTYPVEDS